MHVTGLEQLLRFEPERLDRVEVVGQLAVVALGGPALLEERFGRRPPQTRVEEEEVVLEEVACPPGERERDHVDAPVGVELETRDPAYRGDVLVLLPHRLTEAVDLDLAGLARELQ